jgi:hypothetical protein
MGTRDSAMFISWKFAGIGDIDLPTSQPRNKKAPDEGLNSEQIPR